MDGSTFNIDYFISYLDEEQIKDQQMIDDFNRSLKNNYMNEE